MLHNFHNFHNFAILIILQFLHRRVLRFVILALCDRHKHTYLIVCLVTSFDIVWHFVSSCDIFWHRCGCHIKKMIVTSGIERLYLHVFTHRVYYPKNYGKLAKTGPNWFKPDQTGPNRTRLVQTGTNLSEPARTGPNWSELVQTDPNWSKTVLKIFC